MKVVCHLRDKKTKTTVGRIVTDESWEEKYRLQEHLNGTYQFVPGMPNIAQRLVRLIAEIYQGEITVPPKGPVKP